MMHKERTNPTYLCNYIELPEDRIGLSHRLTHCITNSCKKNDSRLKCTMVSIFFQICLIALRKARCDILTSYSCRTSTIEIRKKLNSCTRMYPLVLT